MVLFIGDRNKITFCVTVGDVIHLWCGDDQRRAINIGFSFIHFEIDPKFAET